MTYSIYSPNHLNNNTAPILIQSLALPLQKLAFCFSLQSLIRVQRKYNSRVSRFLAHSAFESKSVLKFLMGISKVPRRILYHQKFYLRYAQSSVSLLSAFLLPVG